MNGVYYLEHNYLVSGSYYNKDWTGAGLEQLANSCRLMQTRAYSDEI